MQIQAPQHKTTIHEAIAPFVKKVFEKLSEPSLMERWCILGATQNQNESFNSIIWNRCPKTEFAGPQVVEIAVDLAVITFNSGQGALKGLLQRLKYGLGPTLVNSKDDTRIWEADYKGRELVKKRRQMRLDSVSIHEQQVSAEGPTYIPGFLNFFFSYLCLHAPGSMPGVHHTVALTLYDYILHPYLFSYVLPAFFKAPHSQKISFDKLV